MGEPKIKFGDKLFLYGQYLQDIDELQDPQYNSVMGYMTVGGYHVQPVETDVFAASIPGFITDFFLDTPFTVSTPFDQVEMVDVTEKLSLSPPLPFGCKVWMPTTALQ